jgi:hypothetical protein
MSHALLVTRDRARARALARSPALSPKTSYLIIVNVRCAALLLLVIAVPANAGYVFRFRTVTEAHLVKIEQRGRVWEEGDRRRVELDPNPHRPRTFDISISEDGDRTSTLPNLQNKTYYRSGEMARQAPRGAEMFVGTSELYRLPIDVDESVDKISIEVRPSVDEELSGRRVSRHELRFSYRLRGKIDRERLEAVVAATVVRWTAADLPIR